MASRVCTEEEVVASLQCRTDIPGPIDDADEWSDYEFEVYVNNDDEETGGHGEQGDCGEQAGVDLAGKNEESSGEMSGVGSVEDGIPQYTRTPGCTQPVGDESPLHFFSMLVTDDMLGVVEQTNLYASQYATTHVVTPRS